MDKNTPFDPTKAPEDAYQKVRQVEAASRNLDTLVVKGMCGDTHDLLFFAGILMNLERVPSWDETPTICTDGQRLIFNPEWVSTVGADPAGMWTTLTEEVLHIADDHIARGQEIVRNPKHWPIWNEACDLAVVEMLKAANTRRAADFFQFPTAFGFPEIGVGERYLDLPPGKSPEFYFQELLKQQEGADGSPGSGPPQPGPGEITPGEGTSSETQTACREAVVRAETLAEQTMQAKGQQAGNQSGLFGTYAHKSLEPEVHWTDHLLFEVRHLVPGSEEQWLPPSKRHFANDAYMPSVPPEPERGHFACLMDASGSVSCDPNQMDRYASELENIILAFPSKLTIGYHDTRIIAEREWTAEDGPLHLEMLQAGGTSHVQPLAWAAALGEEDDDPPTAILAFTDGYTTYPKKQPHIPVLWIIPKGNPEPPWGTVIRVPIYDW